MVIFGEEKFFQYYISKATLVRIERENKRQSRGVNQVNSTVVNDVRAERMRSKEKKNFRAFFTTGKIEASKTVTMGGLLQ